MKSKLAMLRICFVGAGMLMAVPALACDEKGAFGFEFGQPVPAGAGNPSGGSVSNALTCFTGEVPTPSPEFQQYSYCANRDRKSVYSLEGKVEFAGGRTINNAEADLMQKAAEAIALLRKTWEEKFGFRYSKDFESHELSWTATTPTLRSNIRLWGNFVVVECTNLALEKNALSAAMKSWR